MTVTFLSAIGPIPTLKQVLEVANLHRENATLITPTEKAWQGPPRSLDNSS